MNKGPDKSETPFEGGHIEQRRRTLLETVRDCLRADDIDTLGLILNNQRAADLAALFRKLAEEEQQLSLAVLAESLAAEMFADLDTPTMLEIADDLDDEALSDLVEEMEPDDAADVLGDLSDEQSAKVLELMEEPEAEQVRQLLMHPEDTGGGIMTSRLVSVREDVTVAAAVDRLREWAEEEEEVFYLYVIDERDHLLGTVPLKQLLFASQDAPIRELTQRDPTRTWIRRRSPTYSQITICWLYRSSTMPGSWWGG